MKWRAVGKSHGANTYLYSKERCLWYIYFAHCRMWVLWLLQRADQGLQHRLVHHLEALKLYLLNKQSVAEGFQWVCTFCHAGNYKLNVFKTAIGDDRTSHVESGTVWIMPELFCGAVTGHHSNFLRHLGTCQRVGEQTACVTVCTKMTGWQMMVSNYSRTSCKHPISF